MAVRSIIGSLIKKKINNNIGRGWSMKRRRFDSLLKEFKLVLLEPGTVVCASGRLKDTPTGPASCP